MNQIRTARLAGHAIDAGGSPPGAPDDLTDTLPDTLAAAVARLADCLTATTSYVPALAAAGRALMLAERAERRLAELERLAVTDALTGLLNRRGLEAELKRVMAAARRYREKGVLIFVDLDGFKPINDTYGHAAGDAVLAHVARLLAAHIRATDFAARLGGDEFAVLLTRTDWQQGLKRAESFDALINGATVAWQGRAIAVHASFGFQTYGSGDDLLRALNEADHAMYAAKRARAVA
ncbi:MAG: GGDEF domain-containing protein [Rhodospirillales bacterium]|nr:GGDEF domain-containing protein [Rhodospirillales bacterium]